jgi:hypothetical protein
MSPASIAKELRLLAWQFDHAAKMLAALAKRARRTAESIEQQLQK